MKMKVSVPALLLLSAPASPQETCSGVEGGFRLERLSGECTYEYLAEQYERQVFGATGSCVNPDVTARDDFNMKLGAEGTTPEEIQADAEAKAAKVCRDMYDSADVTPFYKAADKGTDYHFEQMFYNGRGPWQEEVETTQETDDGTATSVLQRDAAKVREFYRGDGSYSRVSWPDSLTNFDESTCGMKAAMCCWPKDRQANDGNGNCATPYDSKCVDKDPADNTNLCFADLEKGDRSTGFGSKEGFMVFPFDNNDGEGAIHCHGFAWDNDDYSAYSRYKANNLFFVSMYDHMHQRGYVENIPGMPMCGCMDQMPMATRSDCTQVDVEEDWEARHDGTSLVAKLTKVEIDFNACRGRNNKNNDLWAMVARLYDQGRVTARQFGAVGRVLTNDQDCYHAVELAKAEKGYVTGYSHDKERWTLVAGRDEMKRGEPYGKKAFRKALFEQSLTAPSDPSAAAFADGETPIIMRICPGCRDTHKKVFYRRLTPLAKDTDLLRSILYDRNDAGGDNKWTEDFTLHSSYDDAVAGANAWKCPNNAFNYGAPFDGKCSPDGTRADNQYTVWNWSPGPQRNVAYYVNKPEDVGVGDYIGAGSTRSGATSRLSDEDIGGVRLQGNTFEDDGTLHITSAGRDVWGQADSFHFLSEPMTGDCIVKVKVASFSNPGNREWSKAGIMLRSDTSPDATNAFLYLTGKKGVWFQTRRSKNGHTGTRVAHDKRDYTNRDSAWIKVVKILDTVETFVSYDGGDDGAWSSLGKDVVNFPEDKFVAGLAVSSNHEWHLAEATFEGYSLVEYSSPTASPTVSAAPTSWDPLADINVQREGSFEANVNNAGWDKLMGSGTGLNDATDSFMFYNHRVPDDSLGAELEVLKLGSWDVGSRGGIMLRDTLDDDSEYVFVGVAGAVQGAVFQSRAAAGERTVHHKMIYTSNSNDNKAFVKLEYKKGAGEVGAYFKVGAGDEWRPLGKAPFKATGSSLFLGRAVTAGSEHPYALTEMRAKPLAIIL